MAEQWKPGIAFLRHLDKEGKSYIQEHTCWNTDLFIASQSKAAIDAGGNVQVVTEAEYRNYRKGV